MGGRGDRVECFAGYDISGPPLCKVSSPIPYTCQDPGTLRNLTVERAIQLSSSLPARISQESLTNVAMRYLSLPMPRPASTSSFHGQGMFSLPVHRRDLDARWQILPTLSVACPGVPSRSFPASLQCPLYALVLFPQEEPAPRLSLSPNRVSFVHQSSSQRPSLNHFPSVICWISSCPSASGILFSDLRPLFP